MQPMLLEPLVQLLLLLVLALLLLDELLAGLLVFPSPGCSLLLRGPLVSPLFSAALWSWARASKMSTIIF